MTVRSGTYARTVHDVGSDAGSVTMCNSDTVVHVAHIANMYDPTPMLQDVCIVQCRCSTWNLSIAQSIHVARLPGGMCNSYTVGHVAHIANMEPPRSLLQDVQYRGFSDRTQCCNLCNVDIPLCDANSTQEYLAPLCNSYTVSHVGTVAHIANPCNMGTRPTRGQDVQLVQCRDWTHPWSKCMVSAVWHLSVKMCNMDTGPIRGQDVQYGWFLAGMRCCNSYVVGHVALVAHIANQCDMEGIPNFAIPSTICPKAPNCTNCTYPPYPPYPPYRTNCTMVESVDYNRYLTKLKKSQVFSENGTRTEKDEMKTANKGIKTTVTERQYSNGECLDCGSAYYLVRIEKTKPGTAQEKREIWKSCGECGADQG